MGDVGRRRKGFETPEKQKAVSSNKRFVTEFSKTQLITGKENARKGRKKDHECSGMPGTSNAGRKKPKLFLLEEGKGKALGRIRSTLG